MTAPQHAQDSYKEIAEEYYRAAFNPHVQSDLKDLDDASQLEQLLEALQNRDTNNFVVDFSDATSWASLDVSPAILTSLIETDRPEALNTRWINIWYPSKQRFLLAILARRYDFSPRLLALMCSDPKEAATSRSSIRPSKRPRRLLHRLSGTDSILEQGPDELFDHSSISSGESMSHGNLYKIISDLWHYSSIDFGRNYVCIGYNSLFGTRPTDNADCNGPLPHCTRVWTWLVLCSDNTVISINEDPFPFSPNNLDPFQQIILTEIRRNLTSVFRSLSTVNEASLMTRAPMTLLPIRTRLGSTPQETAHRQKDMPGLLFYYLFENWHNSYTLITRKESRYGVELNNLRDSMFHLPTLAHIDRLDNIGKELGVLKRHYESYNRIIDRLLEPQTSSTASIQNMTLDSTSAEEIETRSETSLSTIRPNQRDQATLLGVSLSSPARVRFKRLHDLIDLYALSEVNAYLHQKDSLVQMNFQLIAIKESLDVERLTRTTLLLTKLTILFLPISFMTSYFSVPLEGWSYGLREYWIAFGVTLVVSVGALFGFGVVEGSVQTIDFCRKMWKGIRDGLFEIWEAIKVRL